MTLKELAEIVASDINSSTTTVVASVDKDGNLVLTAAKSGPSTGLLNAGVYADTDELVSSDFSGGSSETKMVVVGNEGDTYFQRWDSIKSYPSSDTDANQVLDIASVMLESHINLDGRSDLDRGATKLTNIDWTDYGIFNPVYSQEDNFLAGNDMDDRFNLDTYRSSIVWTGEKKPQAETDEWTHITLGSSLALDGDKGFVRALRRFQNRLIAFQDRGISEILFNSRTQLSTTDGVPVEIANSGKVDGKRYITNKYGTTNKWSVVEGKAGIYFVDNTNKVIGRFGGEGIESLSTKSGLDAWVRNNQELAPWRPYDNKNFVSFYDRIHSDVYFVNTQDLDNPTLVYNEVLDSFTGFFDYKEVPMITNVEDRLISFKSVGGNKYLWLQNEGPYGEFFEENKPFWVTWRVTPDGYTDKIWNTVEYRSDFIEVLNASGDSIINEKSLIDGDVNAKYDKDKTFDTITVWNEYQTTGEKSVSLHDMSTSTGSYPDIRKKFRTWRIGIPRASGTGYSSLDRIRNPWIYLKLKKNAGNFSKEIMQLHDVMVKYFGE